MKRQTLPILLIAIAACGGSADSDPPSNASGAAPEPASQPMRDRPTGPLSMPDWFQASDDGSSVQLSIVAGLTSDQNYWNFNGYLNGAIAVTVPVGARVTIDFENRDPVMPHSIGVSAEVENFMAPPAPTPVFEGAISSDPTSMTGSTLSGERETIEFVADQAGEYTLVCYIAGHTAVGMWVYFVVSDSGELGVRGM